MFEKLKPLEERLDYKSFCRNSGKMWKRKKWRRNRLLIRTAKVRCKTVGQEEEKQNDKPERSNTWRVRTE